MSSNGGFPWQRRMSGGGGDPFRDETGQIVATRRTTFTSSAMGAKSGDSSPDQKRAHEVYLRDLEQQIEDKRVAKRREDARVSREDSQGEDFFWNERHGGGGTPFRDRDGRVVTNTREALRMRESGDLTSSPLPKRPQSQLSPLAAAVSSSGDVDSLRAEIVRLSAALQAATRVSCTQVCPNCSARIHVEVKSDTTSTDSLYTCSLQLV
eukprot:TRINITY_DN3060_c0_g1_i1.p2 TRINITY_DN3060_c0_g1~~TRINITY_DN3060_c0_g1_i1.p2  ORF type:complete len:209 (+),score=29.89 TRINITY_DN3060_c0_g1_i1:79-705(+)